MTQGAATPPVPVSETRFTDFALRKRGHVLFDALWIRGVTEGTGARERRLRERRELCYDWLSAVLGLPKAHTHFSRMSRGDLLRAIELLERTRPRDVDAWSAEQGRRAEQQFAAPKRPAPPKRIGIAAAVLARLEAHKEAGS